MGQSEQSLVRHIHSVNALRESAEKTGLLKQIHALQNWQCQRLLATHSELAQQEKYQRAMNFFVEELYGPQDFSQRDADLARVIPKFANILPANAMQALDDALALNALSFELDMQMVQHLASAPLTRDSYAEAYLTLGRQPDRERQILLVASMGRELSSVANIFGIDTLLKLAKRPAHVAGLQSLHGFLERGFMVFKTMGNIESFMQPVIAREHELMLQLFDPKRDLTKENPVPHV
ncbi:hypothetical protein CA267_016415 [Alteromonas pelagimontana]|uniref:DUF8198 domain-containing protein n=1 Tax=Alteromonas pelagimontana TaxID=1858656 RepID=A0A6M4MGH2_9ALTE|nr:hypothetical protein [Alteromonas pelagimontana]QJR82219.1 hypothetical protein CA267_016415 [Alteromonas pelagimontana]